jgi:hypothetical protein
MPALFSSRRALPRRDIPVFQKEYSVRMISRMLVSGVAIAVLGTIAGTLSGCATESSRALAGGQG